MEISRNGKILKNIFTAILLVLMTVTFSTCDGDFDDPGENTESENNDDDDDDDGDGDGENVPVLNVIASDQDGNEFGVLLGTRGFYANLLVILANKGYIVTIGTFGQFSELSVRYQSTDCTGVAYIPQSNVGYPAPPTGTIIADYTGLLFTVADGQPEATSVTVASRSWTPEPCILAAETTAAYRLEPITREEVGLPENIEEIILTVADD